MLSTKRYGEFVAGLTLLAAQSVNGVDRTVADRKPGMDARLTIQKLLSALEHEGIDFINENGGGPGVRSGAAFGKSDQKRPSRTLFWSGKNFSAVAHAVWINMSPVDR